MVLRISRGEIRGKKDEKEEKMKEVEKVLWYKQIWGKFISIMEKYYIIVNILTFSIFAYVIYINVDWFLVYEYIIHSPENISNFLKQSYIDVSAWIKNFLKKSSEDWMFLISIGITKRYLIENLLTPRIIKHYVRFVFNPIFRYYSIKRRQLRKYALGLKVAISAVFMGPISAVALYFGWMKAVMLLVNKVLVNKVWSFMKFLLLKGIPAILTWSLNLPFVAEVVEYIIISWFLKPLLKIPGAERLYLFVSKSIASTWLSLKEFLINFRIAFIANFYNKIKDKILYFFRRITVAFALKTRNYFKVKVNKILKEYSSDYKSGDHNYDYIFFHKILKRVKNIKTERKKRVKREKKKKRQKQIEAFKNMPSSIKIKAREFMNKKNES